MARLSTGIKSDTRMDEVDTLEAIRKRRSIRRYTDDAIPKADLETIVDAGRLAATGSNRQPWDFVVVTDRTMIEQFKVAGAWIGTAGAVIVVVMDPVSRWWVEDGAAAIENMLLASTALGYGACWVEGDALPREAQFKLLLGVPQREARDGVDSSWCGGGNADAREETFGERASLGKVLIRMSLLCGAGLRRVRVGAGGRNALQAARRPEAGTVAHRGASPIMAGPDRP